MRRRRRPGAGPRARRPVPGVVALLLAGAAWAAPGPDGRLGAQAPLDAVDSLAAAGRSALARERLEAWWERSGTGASRAETQRALWLRGRLSADAGEAERIYQRLVVEFPGGPYGARALLRLGQLAHARGDLPRAAERFRSVVRDHAATPQRLEALRWLERHGARADQLATLGRAFPEDEGEDAEEARPARAEVVPEEAEEIESGAPEARSPEAEEEPPSDPAEAPAHDEGGEHAVQVGAFSRVDGARALAARVEQEGVEARLVRIPGSELIRVRAGRFRGEDEARRLQQRLRRLGFETIVVSDATAEVPFR